MTDAINPRDDLDVRSSDLFKKLKSIFVLEFLEALFAAVVVALLFRLFVVSAYRVPTESMMPNLIPGDVVLAWKSSYGVSWPWSEASIENRWGYREPKRGEVVIFKSADDDLIYVKRVVGVPGDRIEIRDGVVSLNGVPTSLSREAVGELEYMHETSGGSTHRVMGRATGVEPDFLAPTIVPPDHVFLMGDFRTDSLDSRQWGPIPIELIVGRVGLVAFSFEVDGFDIKNPQGLKAKADLAPRARLRWDRWFKRVP